MQVARLLAIIGLLGGCGGQPAAGDAPGGPVAGQSPASAGPAQNRGGWDLQSSGEGVALALLAATGSTTIRLFCPAAKGELLVNVPAFQPIGSEERLSFGSAGDSIALVADPRGDRLRGGVSGTGATPDELKRLLVSGAISASYGAQRSGPHPPPPQELAGHFLRACSEAAQAARVAATKPTPSTSPCNVQDGRIVSARLRAIGTEPFWGARIEGRCVTYSHPDDQKGTRVWTRINSGPVGDIWVGALHGKPFVLRTDPTRRCSDGMSDREYPISVELEVNGEDRRGCAEPL